MPCGCKQGRFSPKTAATESAVRQSGPRAPGYAAPSRNVPKPVKKAADKSKPE